MKFLLVILLNLLAIVCVFKGISALNIDHTTEITVIKIDTNNDITESSKIDGTTDKYDNQSKFYFL